MLVLMCFHNGEGSRPYVAVLAKKSYILPYIFRIGQNGFFNLVRVNVGQAAIPWFLQMKYSPKQAGETGTCAL